MTTKSEPALRAGLGDWVKAAGPPLILVIVLQACYGLAVAHHIAPLSTPRIALTLVLFISDAVGRRLINDYEDHKRGLDSTDTVRPDSSLALRLDMNKVRLVGMAGFALAWVIAIYLAVTSTPWIIALVVICYLAYFAYAGGPFPLGHHGLGEVIDFLVTGTAVTLLVILANVGRLDLTALLAAFGPGFLFCGLMLHNNARDVTKDRAAGKITLPQIVGLRPTQTIYVVAVTGFYVMVAIVALRLGSPWVLLPMLTLPWAVSVMWQVARARELGESMVSWSRLYFVMIANFALFTVGAFI